MKQVGNINIAPIALTWKACFSSYLGSSLCLHFNGMYSTHGYSQGPLVFDMSFAEYTQWLYGKLPRL